VDWIEAVVYGVVQGATEYLPVSSSAHLALVPWLFGWDKPSFAFDVLVQLGTLGAVCFYLREDLRKICVAVFRGLIARKPLEDPWARKGWLIVLATLPAVVIGLLIKDFIEEAFGNPTEVLLELFGTGVLLIVAEAIARKRANTKPVDAPRAVWIGFAQAFAILPGISRSGATIAGALAVGVSREEAGRFSFLMSIPVMLGAGVLGFDDLMRDKQALADELPGLAIAFVVAALVGFACIRWFLGFVRSHSLIGFGIYCCIVAVLGLVAQTMSIP
jgi:undecaprenyl-diphosphatase